MLQPGALPSQPSMDLRVAHSLPGRVRLRFDREETAYAHALACRLRAHPAVRSATWNANGRSLIVQYDAAHELADLIRTLPPSGPPDDLEIGPSRIDWGKVAFSCLLTMLPLGTLGSIALTIATSISEQASAASVPDATAAVAARQPDGGGPGTGPGQGYVGPKNT